MRELFSSRTINSKINVKDLVAKGLGSIINEYFKDVVCCSGGDSDNLIFYGDIFYQEYTDIRNHLNVKYAVRDNIYQAKNYWDFVGSRFLK